MLHPHPWTGITNSRLTVRTSTGSLYADITFQSKPFVAFSTTQRTVTRAALTLDAGAINTAALERKTLVPLQAIAVEAA